MAEFGLLIFFDLATLRKREKERLTDSQINIFKDETTKKYKLTQKRIICNDELLIKFESIQSINSDPFLLENVNFLGL